MVCVNIYLCKYISEILIHSFPMHRFSTSWKHQKTVRFSDVFKGWRKGALGTSGLKCHLRILCLVVFPEIILLVRANQNLIWRLPFILLPSRSQSSICKDLFQIYLIIVILKLNRISETSLKANYTVKL